MQSILNSYNSGIKIDSSAVCKEVDPPAACHRRVSATFKLPQADFEKETSIKAGGEPTPNRSGTPAPSGEADRIIANAEGYRDQTIAEATGQAARFLKVYEEYKKAPDVTRDRLFLEMQERVLSNTDKIILDQKEGGQGVVPFLPLDQLTKPKQQTEGGQ
jgi:membrane protease subunit HflK